MARPKKVPVTPTTETIPNMEVEQTAVIPSAEPAMKQTAYSFYRAEKLWEVVKINFDEVTGATKKPEVLIQCESEAEALNAFKINVARDLMQRNRTSE